MSNYDWLTPRRRRQNLFIVEGNHEKNELISLILKMYPEIDINMEEILIYGTNIYMLYNEIESLYQEDWDYSDVDLPYIVGKKRGYEALLNKDDFNNIILIFDYERHDPNFSEEKITRMQTYFDDSTDVGKLYINYPMIESYQHLVKIPDNDYENRSIPVTLQPGHKYKKLVKDTQIGEMIDLPNKIDCILRERFGLSNEELRIECLEKILSINNSQELLKQIEELLKYYLDEKVIETAKHQFNYIVMRAGYASVGKGYYVYMRNLFNHIIKHNISKANKLGGKGYQIKDDELKEAFYKLGLRDILLIQNQSSRDKIRGVIWILNTSVFIVPDYNFNLISR